MKKTALIAATALLLAAFPAFGQDRGFSVQTFQPAPGRDNYLTLEGARVSTHLGFSVGGIFVYQFKPLVLRACHEIDHGICTDWSTRGDPLVEHHLELELSGSIAIFRVFEAALAFPIVMYQGGKDAVDASGAVVARAPSHAGGLEDMRLHLKLDLFHLFKYFPKRIGLALVPVLTFPVGNAVHERSFMGDSSVTVHIKAAFEIYLERVRFGFNVGYMWRESKNFYMAWMGQRMTYGAALDFKFVPKVSGLLELHAQSGFSPDLIVNPVELDLAVRARLPCDLVLTAGLGWGVVAGVAQPLVRAFAGLAWAPVVAEKKKPVAEKPKPQDKDGDGILDGDDKCPKKAEDRDKFEDEDGCPDEDNDKDGIKDEKDECPDEAEDKDKFEDGDGCPDPDNDKDGIADADDKCPDEAEDEDKFEDEDGCPDEDNDTDGVPDDKDKCPAEKEVYNDFEDEDGCPDEGKALLEVTESQLTIVEKVHFAVNSDKIVGKKSFKVLDAVIKIMKANPKMKLRIEGHTDNQGSRELNMDLSQRRAEAVKKYIVDGGIKENRLKAVGYGPDKPIADNDTKEGRAANRRVEFHIVKD
jgi:outer membrane protein OmpA-like peptidoglycan-associated protein